MSMVTTLKVTYGHLAVYFMRSVQVAVKGVKCVVRFCHSSSIDYTQACDFMAFFWVVFLLFKIHWCLYHHETSRPVTKPSLLISALPWMLHLCLFPVFPYSVLYIFSHMGLTLLWWSAMPVKSRSLQCIEGSFWKLGFCCKLTQLIDQENCIIFSHSESINKVFSCLVSSYCSCFPQWFFSICSF
jgi:hypothetical protein